MAQSDAPHSDLSELIHRNENRFRFRPPTSPDAESNDPSSVRPIAPMLNQKPPFIAPKECINIRPTIRDKLNQTTLLFTN